MSNSFIKFLIIFLIYELLKILSPLFIEVIKIPFKGYNSENFYYSLSDSFNGLIYPLLKEFTKDKDLYDYIKESFNNFYIKNISDLLEETKTKIYIKPNTNIINDFSIKGKNLNKKKYNKYLSQLNETDKENNFIYFFKCNYNNNKIRELEQSLINSNKTKINHYLNIKEIRTETKITFLNKNKINKNLFLFLKFLKFSSKLKFYIKSNFSFTNINDYNNIEKLIYDILSSEISFNIKSFILSDLLDSFIDVGNKIIYKSHKKKYSYFFSIFRTLINSELNFNIDPSINSKVLLKDKNIKRFLSKNINNDLSKFIKILFNNKNIGDLNLDKFSFILLFPKNNTGYSLKMNFPGFSSFF